ncbi:pyruvate dehydrogenase subunit E1 [Salinisphaera sp. PC39]|uniref:pyruvate dehydrogenase (acetyl-transferring), homodimeric type n=1 Tax=Salinisphaera sp. PC39 TaxID=1304156 RepID=UPI00333FB376
MSQSEEARLAPARNGDVDAEETREWLDALEAVLEHEGPERAHFLLEALIEKSRRSGAYIPFSPYTAYVNTIPSEAEARSPGDPAIEWRIRSIIRWNAMAMVVQANRHHEGVGGHIASFASAATLYDVGFNHFFHAPSEDHDGDLVYIQGHSAPGIYARSYLEGRLDEKQLYNFRAEVGGKGLSSYPHAWLMPDYWQFATVSMGIGPISAIYQARFMRYLENRGVRPTDGRKVWCFCGDGEMDEPESLGAIDVASREKLDNLVFVVNCNLQRLDGPVRGDSKIIQELEGAFRGAGWNVIKVIWGALWDGLLAQDHDGLLVKRMNECVDGEYQAFKAKGGAYTRKHFFGKYPELERMVASLSDEDISRLNRGGHDPHKIYAAYHRAVNLNNGRPTVILAKTVKGYGMGEAGEGQNITHQQKKMGEEALKEFRDRFEIPVDDDKIGEAPFYKPPEDSEEIQYLKARREELGGYLPKRRQDWESLTIPELKAFDRLLADSGDREYSTTMAFVRILQMLTRDKNIGERVVPIVPDEARTFGMEGLFRSLGIYSPVGQLFEPEDSDQLAYYKEAINGQILEEGITEAGSMSSFIAAGTSYYNHGVAMIPFYSFYSMFGHQRVGDLCWAAGDMRTRGFLMAGTAGRTTLNGEGLQHQDGHSLLLMHTIPNCRAYDPTFAYELAVIVQDGLRRMYAEHEDVYYYITMMNENYAHPAMPEGAAEGIVRGMYRFSEGDGRLKKRVQLLGSGTILRESIAAVDLLAEDWKVAADVWSVPSFGELRRDGLSAERWNTLHPEAEPRVSYVAQCLGDAQGPVIAATDYMRAYADLIRAFVPAPYYTLGTDGFGRSDTRESLRDFFEVDRYWITVAALKALADAGEIKPKTVSEAIEKYGIDPEKPEPLYV